MERGLEHERAVVRRDADLRLAARQARVDRAEAIAAHEVALRRDTEEKLKYAFMRHVATLNLEVGCNEYLLVVAYAANALADATNR